MADQRDYEKLAAQYRQEAKDMASGAGKAPSKEAQQAAADAAARRKEEAAPTTKTEIGKKKGGCVKKMADGGMAQGPMRSTGIPAPQAGRPMAPPQGMPQGGRPMAPPQGMGGRGMPSGGMGAPRPQGMGGRGMPSGGMGAPRPQMPITNTSNMGAPVGGMARPTAMTAGPQGMAIKKGGAIKAKKMAAGGKVSSASKRADGCAQRGKTRGKMV